MIQNALWRGHAYFGLKKIYMEKKSYYSLSPSDLSLDLLSFCSQEDIYAQTSVGNLAASWHSTFQRDLILYFQNLEISATSICNKLVFVRSIKLHCNV